MGPKPSRKVYVVCIDDEVALRVLDQHFAKDHDVQRVRYLREVKPVQGRSVLIMSRADHKGRPVRYSVQDAVTKQLIPPKQRDKFDTVLVVSRASELVLGEAA